MNRNDVAKKAGVSGATVSRVFNSPDSVSTDTRDRVYKAAEELGYHPNVIASNFVRGISGNVGVVIPQIPHVHIFSVYYFSEVLSGIGESLRQHGYDLMLFFHNTREEGENDYLPYFRGGKVDGCILLGTRQDDKGLLKLQQAGLKFCLVNNYLPDSGISFIDVDNRAGSYEAVTHLLELGHRNIAFLNGPPYYSNSIDRYEGYSRALRQKGMEIDPCNLLEGNYGRKSGYAAAAKFLQLRNRPTALFAANDRMAAGILQGFRDRGLRIPQDVSLVGYDDSDIATMAEPQLTTVRIPFYELGSRCAEEFVKVLQNRTDESFSIFIKPRLIKRASTAICLL